MAEQVKIPDWLHAGICRQIELSDKIARAWEEQQKEAQTKAAADAASAKEIAELADSVAQQLVSRNLITAPEKEAAAKSLCETREALTALSNLLKHAAADRQLAASQQAAADVLNPGGAMKSGSDRNAASPVPGARGGFVGVPSSDRMARFREYQASRGG